MRLINLKPSRGTQLLLMLAPFALLALGYTLGSTARLAENPSDKLLPALATLADAIDRMAFQPDARTGEFLLWSDTSSSLGRLFSGLGVSTAIALTFGMAI